MKFKLIKYVLFPIFTMGVVVSANSAENPEQKCICYVFNKDKLINKGNCVINSGTGAGGYWLMLKYRGKSYGFEEAYDDKNSTWYMRDSKYKKIKNPEKLTMKQYSQALSCEKHKPYDICYKTFD